MVRTVFIELWGENNDLSIFMMSLFVFVFKEKKRTPKLYIPLSKKIQLICDKPKASYGSLVERHGLKKSTINHIIQQKDKLLEKYHDYLKLAVKKSNGN